MKLRQLFDRLQHLYSKGVKSDDSRLKNRYLYNKLLTTRAKLIVQQYKKKQLVSQWNYQTLPCVELIKVPASQCPCMPPSGCMMLRSAEKLPEPLMGFTEELIQNVTTAEGALKIDRVTLNAVKSQKGNKYTSKKMNFFIHGGYLFITTPSSLGAVTVTGLFEDPMAASLFKNLCDDCDDCLRCADYLEFDFPIDNDMVDSLVELAAQEVIVAFSQGVEDTTNNSRDNSKEQGK